MHRPIIFAVLAVFIAPILEEWAYRGWFLTSKKRRRASYSVYAVLLLLMVNHIVASAVIFCISVVTIVLWETKKLPFWGAALLCAFLFMSAHFAYIPQWNWGIVIPAFSRLGVGLILIYITCKYALKYSILTHALYNLVLVGMMFIGLQFTDSKIHHLQKNAAHLTYQSIPYLSGSSGVHFKVEKDTLIFNGNKVGEFLKLWRISRQLPQEEQVQSNSSFQKYKIKFWIEGDKTHTKAEQYRLLKVLLEEAELIKTPLE